MQFVILENVSVHINKTDILLNQWERQNIEPKEMNFAKKISKYQSNYFVSVL